MDRWRKKRLVQAHELLLRWRDVWVTPGVDRDELVANTRDWLAIYEDRFEEFIEPKEDDLDASS